MRHLMEEQEFNPGTSENRCRLCRFIKIPDEHGTVNCYDIFESLHVYYYKVRKIDLTKMIPPKEGLFHLYYCYQGTGIFHDAGKKHRSLGAGDYLFLPSAGSAAIETVGEYIGLTVVLDIDRLNRFFAEFFSNTEFECFIHEPYVSKEGKFLFEKTEKVILSALEEFCKDYRRSNINALKVKCAEVLYQIYDIHQTYRLKNYDYVPKYRLYIMELVRQYLEDNLENQIRLEDIAQQYHMSLSTLKISFKAIYGVPAYTYLKKIRMEKAEHLLVHTDLSITDIAHKVGYTNASKFAEAFREKYGICPSEMRKFHP